MQGLSQVQLNDLSIKLESTLSNFDLQAFFGIATGDQLAAWVTVPQPRLPLMRDTLIRLDDAGQVGTFLKIIYLNRPHRDDVRALIASICPQAASDLPASFPDYAIQTNGIAGPSIAAESILPGLQRNIKPHIPNFNILEWVDGLMSAKRRACRIEVAGQAAGSGFLVGPQAVLTNWHVVEGAQASGRVGDIACRFDYVKLTSGARSQGTVVPLGPRGIVHHSPYAPAEKTTTPDTPPPNKAELDFALLHLATAIGNETFENVRRGWVRLPKAPIELPTGAPIIIVQHPDGAPMKIAIDTNAVLPVPPPSDRPRIRYATNTAPGSSGSPSFSMDWSLVALHHFGDPAWQTPKFNQGIPAWLIQAELEAAHCGDLLHSP